MGPSVVLVDDHAGFRAYAAGLLERAGYEVVASCADGLSALAAIAELVPDLVVLDVQLPGIDAFEVLARLDGIAQSPTVVLVSSREEADYGGLVGRSGAAGFITKAELSAQSLSRLVAP